MVKSTEELKREHEAVLKALGIMEKIGPALDEGQPQALDHARRIMEFLTVFVDKCHHGKEEKVLFPALQEPGVPESGGPVGVMLMKHDQGRAYIQGMTVAPAAISGGQREEAAASFAANARSYAELLRR